MWAKQNADVVTALPTRTRRITCQHNETLVDTSVHSGLATPAVSPKTSASMKWFTMCTLAHLLLRATTWRSFVRNQRNPTRTVNPRGATNERRASRIASENEERAIQKKTSEPGPNPTLEGNPLNEDTDFLLSKNKNHRPAFFD